MDLVENLTIVQDLDTFQPICQVFQLANSSTNMPNCHVGE
jgi:hypothetical protein